MKCCHGFKELDRESVLSKHSVFSCEASFEVEFFRVPDLHFSESRQHQSLAIFAMELR
jgi:hypothetical protein